MAFPQTRLRRLRASPALRGMVRETRLAADDFIYPLFVVFGLSPKFGAYLLFGCGLIVATFVDIEHRIIPDEISIGGMVIGIAFGSLCFIPRAEFSYFPPLIVSLIGSLVGIGLICMGRILFSYAHFLITGIGEEESESAEPEKVDIKSCLREILILTPGAIAGWFFFRFVVGFTQNATVLSGVLNAVIGAAVGASVIYLTGILGDIIFKQESMGGGDIKLLAMIGAFLGWQAALVTYMLSLFLGSAVGVVIKIVKKTSLIPYGPFLSAGALITLFWYNKIIAWLVGQYSF